MAKSVKSPGQQGAITKTSASRAPRGATSASGSTRAIANPPGATVLQFGLGLVCLIVCVGASAILVGEHLFGLHLPGCGMESPCATLTRSVWGKVPGLDWPVSFVGLAFFLGLLLSWIIGRGALGAALRWLVRLGALASLGFIWIMITKQQVCPYCLTAHVANLAFAVLVETRRGAPAGGSAALRVGVVGFFVVTLILAPLEWNRRAREAAQDESDRRGTAQQIIQTSQSQPAASQSARRIFTGRYRWGPETAPVRIVMFTGYQCPDCQKIERELQGLMDTRKDISVSIKHFPMNSDCNKYMNKRHHGNACWAARAAEAAGILYGNDGFWKMHKWLFEKEGSFTSNEEIEGGLRSLGLDPAGFLAVMKSAEPGKRITDDVEEGVSYGINSTPSIFINGVELRGWRQSGALTRTVEQVLATNPPAAGAEVDQPPLALQKMINDWREGNVRRPTPEKTSYTRGPADAPIRILVFGDYEEENTARLDQAIRAAIGGRQDVQYTYRQYPFNNQCNSDPNITEARNPNACQMARAAEAAGMAGGGDAFWRMHEWLLTNQKSFSAAALEAALATLNLDPAKFKTALEADESKRAIEEDVAAGRKAGLTGIPMLIINDRHVPRWRQQNEKPILNELLEAALLSP